ncbi:MAG: hypothetical protein KDA91_09925 [Planctomycetaceae bacterium]|nr:hypothetical protein [Planctomycetaceae bacterium]
MKSNHLRSCVYATGVGALWGLIVELFQRLCCIDHHSVVEQIFARRLFVPDKLDFCRDV